MTENVFPSFPADVLVALGVGLLEQPLNTSAKAPMLAIVLRASSRFRLVP